MTIDKFGRHLNVVGSTHQTIVDKFGRHLRGSAEEIHSTFLPHTSDGNYDVGGKRLCNVQDPKDKQDCATKTYVIKQVDIASSRGKATSLLLEKKINARLQSSENKINDSEKRLKLKLDVLEKGLNSIQNQLSLLQKRIEDLEKK